MIKISKGLDLPISGTPICEVEEQLVRSIGILGSDYPNLKPKMHVNIGDTVRAGDTLFEDKKNAGVAICTPVSGEITDINRGEKRKLLSIEIEVNNSLESLQFSEKNSLDLLIKSGCFSYFKTRPFNRIPKINSKPNAIFINCCDSNPLAINPQTIIDLEDDLFQRGLKLVQNLFSDIEIYCTYQGNKPCEQEDIIYKEFSGPHPSGLVGTHIHFLRPVDLNKEVWSIGFQEIISLGYLDKYKSIKPYKYIALSGEGAFEPKILKTYFGADIDELTAGRIQNETRVISGSVLNGIHANGAMRFLGNFCNQISVIPDKTNDILFNWAMPGKALHSKMGTFLSSWITPSKFIFNTSLNGGNRAIVPISTYDEVMPLNILATPLLKSIVTKDIELGVKLGVLELVPEDLGLMSYVCPSKYDYQTILQENLDLIYDQMI